MQTAKNNASREQILTAGIETKTSKKQKLLHGIKSQVVSKSYVNCPSIYTNFFFFFCLSKKIYLKLSNNNNEMHQKEQKSNQWEKNTFLHKK